MPKQERESLFCHHCTDLKKDLSQLSIENGGEKRTVSQPVPQIYFGSTNSNLSEGFFEE